MIEQIDAEKCTGCGDCELVCRKNVLRMERKRQGKKWRRISYITDPRECVVCYGCVRVCTEGAIKLGYEKPPEAFRKALPEFWRLAVYE